VKSEAVEGFKTYFGCAPEILVQAPGRVNLLGGHTDYNDGFVLPAAIDRAAWVAARPVAEPRARVRALDLGEESDFSLNPVPAQKGTWSDFPRGVAWALRQAGLVTTGLEAVLTSDVPVGAGLSSSAAVQIAFAWAWRAAGGLGTDRTEIAQICQRAENEYVGLRCGIMDQMASAHGRAGHALLLDCRTLHVRPVPLPEGVSIVVGDTNVRRELASSAYNERRAACEEAVRILAHYKPGVRALRDVSPEELNKLAHHLPETIRKRARHVVTDNARVIEAVGALHQGDLGTVGDAMRRCHESLRDDCEVSSPELDVLAEAAWRVPGCYGARLTGAGFGGCVVALVARDAVDELAEQWNRAYTAAFDRQPTVYLFQAADGVSALDSTDSFA
jgi:galactokinase